MKKRRRRSVTDAGQKKDEGSRRRRRNRKSINETVFQDDKIQAAKEYAELGYAVFPLTANTKVPLKGSHGYKDGTSDPEKVFAEFEKGHNCNIGISTHEGIVCIDVDCIGGLENPWLDGDPKKKKSLLNAPTVVTPTGGKHHYFKAPEGKEWKSDQSKLAKKVDVRAVYGYAVLPPSERSEGKYEWIKGNEIVSFKELPEPPEWLVEELDIIAKEKEKKDKGLALPPPNKKEFTKEEKVEVVERSISYISKMPESISGQEGHNALYAAACTLVHGFCLDENTAFKILNDEFNPRCKPPWSDHELWHKVTDAGVKSHLKEYGHLLGNGRNENSSTAKEDQVTKVIALLDNAKLILSKKDKVPYAQVVMDGHKELHALGSPSFKKWVSLQYYVKYQRGLKSEIVNEAMVTLEAKAQYEGVVEDVFLRVGKNDGSIFVDLCNDSHQVVEISSKGWCVLDDSPVNFSRKQGMSALPIPETGGDLMDLKDFLNVETHEDFIFIAAFLIAAFWIEGPHAFLFLKGPQGSAKSTAAEVIRSMVDPNDALLRTLPKGVRDLSIELSNSWCTAYENVSSISPDISDALCRISTGAGQSQRKLFKDDEEQLFNICRPLTMNGIVDYATRPDLIDRAVDVFFKTIPDNKKKDEMEFWKTFDRQHSSLLGGLLDAVAVGLQNINNVQLHSSPRMVDFTKRVTAAEPALGLSQGEFVKIYQDRISDTIRDMAASDPACVMLMEYIDQNGTYEGTFINLHDTLKHNIGYPHKHVNGFSGKVKRMIPSLLELGYSVETGLPGPKSRGRDIRIEKILPPSRISRSKTDFSPSSKEKCSKLTKKKSFSRKKGGNRKTKRESRGAGRCGQKKKSPTKKITAKRSGGKHRRTGE